MEGKTPTGLESSKYHYDQKLGTCIVEISDSTTADTVQTNTLEVIDADQNKQLLNCMVPVRNEEGSACFNYSDDRGDKRITKEEFDLLEREYMTQ